RRCRGPEDPRELRGRGGRARARQPGVRRAATPVPRGDGEGCAAPRCPAGPCPERPAERDRPGRAARPARSRAARRPPAPRGAAPAHRGAARAGVDRPGSARARGVPAGAAVARAGPTARRGGRPGRAPVACHTMNCPVCQAEAQGAYCAECGAPLEGATCRGCQAPLVPGARYCVACGQPVRGATSNMPWYIAGAALVALVAVVLGSVLRSEPPAPAAAPASAAGDSAEVSFFLPMALAAYRQAGPLDADGLYHLSVLEIAAGDPAAARATAERILETEPDHLLGLAAAARAARDAGENAAAR